MADLHPEDRQSLKDSVVRAISEVGCGKKARKKFKKQVARSMSKTTTLPIHKYLPIETEALELIDILWKEVVTEEKEARV